MGLEAWEQMVVVGRIVRPQGNRGEVVVASETDFADERFRAGARLETRREERLVTLTVHSSREHNGRWVIGFEGVGSIDDAEALRGTELRIPADELKALGAGRFYVHDLIGCLVETTEGVKVGLVGGVQLGTGTPVLEVAGRSGEVLVPLAEEICRTIDIRAKVIVIEAIDGLLDLPR